METEQIFETLHFSSKFMHLQPEKNLLHFVTCLNVMILTIALCKRELIHNIKYVVCCNFRLHKEPHSQTFFFVALLEHITIL